MRLFGKKRTGLPDFSACVADIHCHVLPGLDDGAATLGESLTILRAMATAGFRKVIATPHVNNHQYPNTRERILGQWYHLQDRIREESIPIILEVSAEYHIDSGFSGLLHSGELIPFGREQYLLAELPFHKPDFPYMEILLEVQSAGYKPVIAHPERYFWLMGMPGGYENLKGIGAFFQLNLNSISGMYGFPIRLTAQRLIRADMIEFIGTDAHYPGHITEMDKLLSNKYFNLLMNSGTLLNPGV